MPLKKLYPILEEHYPGIIEEVLKSCALTINLEYVDVEDADGGTDEDIGILVQPGDEVAIIPPVSSG